MKALQRVLKLPFSLKEKVMVTNHLTPPSRKEIDPVLKHEIEFLSLKFVSGGLKKETLKKVVPSDKSFSTKAAYWKSIFTESGDLSSWLSTLGREVLQEIASETLGIDDDEIESKEKPLREQVMDVLLEIGVENFMRNCSQALLLKCCKKADLIVSSSNTKPQLLKAFVTGKIPKIEKKVTTVKMPSKEKPALKKGISKEDLQHHFNFDELREWCKEKNIKTAGNKKLVIKRILAFFDGDQSIFASETKRGKKPKKTGNSTSKSPAKKKTKVEEKKEGKKVQEKKPEKKGQKPVEKQEKKKKKSPSPKKQRTTEKSKSPANQTSPRKRAKSPETDSKAKSPSKKRNKK